MMAMEEGIMEEAGDLCSLCLEVLNKLLGL